MVFFDVKSLFTNNPLDQTIAVILKRIYDGDELRSHLQEMKWNERIVVIVYEEGPFYF